MYRTVGHYRCEGCGLEWTPTRADGRRNGQRCPRCGGLLVRATATVEPAAPQPPRATGTRAAFDRYVAALEEIARAVAAIDDPWQIQARDGRMLLVCRFARSHNCVIVQWDNDTMPVGPPPHWQPRLNHVPGCPVTLARALLGEETQ